MAVLMGGHVQVVVQLSAACRWQISQAAGGKAEKLQPMRPQGCPNARGAVCRWYYYRVAGVQGRELRMNIVNAGEASYPSAWQDYQSMASYDRKYWFRVPTVWNKCAPVSSCNRTARKLSRHGMRAVQGRAGHRDHSLMWCSHGPGICFFCLVDKQGCVWKRGSSTNSGPSACSDPCVLLPERVSCAPLSAAFAS